MATVWTTKKLSDCVSFRTGKLNSNAAVENGEYPFFTCSQEIYKTDKWAFDTECVLLGGNNASAIYPIFYYKGKFNAYQRTYVIEPKGHNQIRFFYYLILRKLDELKDKSTGAATRFLTIKILHNIDVSLPDVPTQTRIASVLSAYDDLIENNEKRIKALEEMAQLLYTEWFVKFKFPGHEKVKMIDSKTEYGVIPEGWEFVSLFDLTSILSGGTPKTDESKYWNGEIKFYTPKDAIDSPYVIETERTLTKVGLERCNSQLYPQNTVFITARGTVGNVNLSGENMAINQSCYALIGSQSIDQYFLFISIKNAVIQLKSKTHGAVFATIIIDTFKHIKVVKPTAETMQAFSKLVDPIFKKILVIQKKNQVLSKIRHLLIPQLVTGKRRLKKT